MYHCFRIDGYRDIYDANTMVEGGGGMAAGKLIKTDPASPRPHQLYPPGKHIYLKGGWVGMGISLGK